MTDELIKVAIEINQEREKLRKQAQELNKQMAQLAMREKQAFGVGDGDKIAIPDLVQLIHKVLNS
jgi:hypothetical protein